MFFFFFFVKQKTAYEMRISDWSSDVCSSDLCGDVGAVEHDAPGVGLYQPHDRIEAGRLARAVRPQEPDDLTLADRQRHVGENGALVVAFRSEEHTSELQSLMRISYAVFCLKKKKKTQQLNISQSKQILHK